MAIPWRRDPSTTLESQPWRSITIEGKALLVKGVFLNSSYSVLCTDLCLMWEEVLDEEKLLDRSKSLNPHIEAPSSVIIQQLLRRLLDGPLTKCKYSIINSTESLLTLSVSGPLQGDSGPEYQWDFCLHKTPSLVLKHQLVNPLLSMTVELLRQRNRLVGIIEKKDKEIRDYKDNGSVVSRKHLETMPFDEKAFANEMIVAKDFQVSSVDPMASIDSSWQELYRDLSLCRNWVSSTNDGTGSPAGMLGSMGGTWENKLPPSLTSSTTTSPTVSPHKRPLVESSPSKDVEKMRRLELEKQLESSKAKNKKKKKKLM